MYLTGSRKNINFSFLLLTVVFLFAFSTQTFAVDFTVNLTTDEHDADTTDGICDIDTATVGLQCTLRAAVEQANALATDDNISFNSLPANSTVTLTTANGGEITITNNGSLTINGLGANLLTIDGGAGTNRIFYTNNATVTISGVTLTGGNGTGASSSGQGGAIYASKGSLTLDRVHVRDNTGFQGGGVSVARPSTPGGSGTYLITNSTFSGNTANVCGAIDNDNGTLTVLNTTVSGNKAVGGGGFCNLAGTTILRNVTITNNTAEKGGGILVDRVPSPLITSEFKFANTIVAGNIATNSFPEIGFTDGTLTSEGNNLVGDSPGDSTNTGNAITYQSTDIRDVNPLLGPLQNNGGPTPTQALLFGSPAIDAGNNCVFLATCPSGVPPFALLTDQRGAGFTRSADGNGDTIQIVDIGAYEVQFAPTAATVSISGHVTTSLGRSIMNVRLSLTDSQGNVRAATTDSSGYYQFTDVQVGETYILSATGKHYTFSQPLQVLNVNDETNQIDFIANSEKRIRSF